MQRSVGILVLSFLLGFLVLTLGGCASTKTVHEVRTDVAVNSANINNLDRRVTRLESQADERKASSAHCAPLVVHDSGRSAAVPSSESTACTHEYSLGTFNQKFSMAIEVETFLTGDGRFAYKHPHSDEICLLDPVPIDFQGGTVTVEVDFHLEGEMGARITGRNIN